MIAPSFLNVYDCILRIDTIIPLYLRLDLREMRLIIALYSNINISLESDVNDYVEIEICSSCRNRNMF